MQVVSTGSATAKHTKNLRRREAPKVRSSYLGLVSLPTLGARIGPLVRMHSPVPLHVCNCLVQLATLPTTEPPLVHMHFLMLFQQVSFGEFFATLLTGKRFVVWGRNERRWYTNKRNSRTFINWMSFYGPAHKGLAKEA